MGVHSALPLFAPAGRMVGLPGAAGRLDEGFLPRRRRLRLHRAGADPLRHPVQRQHSLCLHRQDLPDRLRLDDECPLHDGGHRLLPAAGPEAPGACPLSRLYHPGGLPARSLLLRAAVGAGLGGDDRRPGELSPRPADGHGACCRGTQCKHRGRCLPLGCHCPGAHYGYLRNPWWPSGSCLD